MTYFADLDLCRYHVGPFDTDNWAVPLRAVGWLEHPYAFDQGVVPYELIPKLKAMVTQVHEAYSSKSFRGVKMCSLCHATTSLSPGPIWSQENLFVPGTEAVYVAPGGIVHYIEDHSYLPPSEFIEAVLRCPDFRSAEYREALRSANRGIEPPLETDEAFRLEISKFVRK